MVQDHESQVKDCGFYTRSLRKLLRALRRTFRKDVIRSVFLKKILVLLCGE